MNINLLFSDNMLGSRIDEMGRNRARYPNTTRKIKYSHNETHSTTRYEGISCKTILKLFRLATFRGFSLESMESVSMLIPQQNIGMAITLVEEVHLPSGSFRHDRADKSIFLISLIRILSAIYSASLETSTLV